MHLVRIPKFINALANCDIDVFVPNTNNPILAPAFDLDIASIRNFVKYIVHVSIVNLAS